MRLLICYNLTEARQDGTTSPVELWRTKRPGQALREHTDWKVSDEVGIFPDAKKIKDVTEEEMQKRLDLFGSYDMVWGSYYTNPVMYSFTQVIQEKTGTRFVMDCDDNIYDIDPLNPIHVNVEKKYLDFLKVIVADCDYLTTSTETLANVLRGHRPDKRAESVVVIPNMISTKVYKHDPIDNGDKIVIGYFGGSSHWGDLHHTGMADAIEKIMHEYKNVYFKSAGMVFDKYLPKARYEFIGGQRGEGWYDLFSTLNYDIAVAPLEETPFTACKSNIKWQESAIMGACFVGSNTGPYRDSVKSGTDGFLVENTYESWYNTLKTLVENTALRKKVATKAKETVINEHSLELNYQKVKDGLQKIYNL